MAVKKWENHTLVEDKLERLHQEANETAPELTNNIAKYGAVEYLSRFMRSLLLKNKLIALQMIKLFSIKTTSGQQIEKDSS